MIECMQPFKSAPVLHFKFESNDAPALYRVPLPILLPQFLESASLDGPEFLTRWERLSASTLEAVETVATALSLEEVTARVAKMKVRWNV